MTSGLNTGLSLLSRGIGEERNHAGHKKLEVCLEPQDYHNITPRKFYLPPLHHHQQHAWPSTPATLPRQISTHKTFTTRKGALLLYAEDLALTAKEQPQIIHEQHTKALEAEDTSLFNTFDDLRSAILSYGAKDESPAQTDGVYLGFVHSKHSFQTPRTIRPGFSAKRYLSSWTKSWDDTVLNDLRTKGHIWDKNLFQSNSLDANLKHRISDDLSRVPGPYRFTKNMLMAPGAAGSYEFYRIRPHSADSGRPSEDDSEIVTKSLPPVVPAGTPNLLAGTIAAGTIAAIVRDKENKPHAVVYSQLDRNAQQEILQRLLMQSAIHKQHQVVEDSATMKALSIKSQQGSRDVTPLDVVTGVNDIDIGIAIEALVSSNSVNLLDGEQVFDDHQLAEMYKAYFGHHPPSATSSRKGHPKPPHKVSFPHHPTLPPIKKSPAIRRPLKLFNAELPIITMEPATPKQPKQSITSRLSAASYSTMNSARSSSANWPSEESNVWQADIDEDDLLRQQEAETRSEYDGDEEGPGDDDEDVADSTKLKITGSAKEDVEGSTGFSFARSTKQSVKSLSKHGSALSLDSASMLLEAKTHSKSLENLSMAAKGGMVPENRKESMRSYKGGTRSLSNSRSGSAILDSDADVMLIGSNTEGAGEKAVVATSAGNQVTSTDLHYEDNMEPVYPDQATLAPVVAQVKWDQVSAEETVKQDQVEPELDKSPVKQVKISPVIVKTLTKQSENVGQIVNFPVKQDLADISKVTTPSEKNARADDMLSMDSGHISADEQPEAITEPNVDQRSDHITAELPSTPPQQSQCGSMPGSVQSIPVAEVGMGLPAAPSVEDLVVTSRRTHSIPSVAGSVKSSQDHAQGDVDIMASFHNFSYESANNSRKNSINSANEDVLPIDGNLQMSEGESGAEEERHAHEGSKHISESEQENTTASENEEETDAEKMESRLASGKLSIASGSVRSAYGMSHRATPASQLIELEEHAAAVAAAVLQQRPKSGRDLAMDAQIASELWAKKLSELFVPNDTDIERSRSAFVGRRRNSMDSVESQGDGDNTGRWTGASFLAPKPQIRKSRRKRRIHSAKAAVRFIKELLRKDPVNDDENKEENLEEMLLKQTQGDAEDGVVSTHSSKPPSAIQTGDPSQQENQPATTGGAFSLDVTNIGKADKNDVEKQPLVVRPPEEASDKSSQDEAKAEDATLQQIIQDTGLLQKGRKSSKSSKSSKSVKSNSSKNSQDNSKEKEEFVVGLPQDDKADHLLYKPLPEPEPKPEELHAAQQKEKKAGPKQPTKKTKKPAPAKKTKKKNTKEDEELLPPEAQEEKPVKEAEAKPEKKEETDKEPEASEKVPDDDDEGNKDEKEGGDLVEESEGMKSPESPEFVIIEDEFSSSDEDELQDESTISIAPSEDVDLSEFMSTFTEDSTIDGRHSISNQQAKAAKRAAEKEKRRLAVERKRQEREEARRKAIEKAELQEQLKREYEEEQRRKEEEIRLRKEQEEAEKLAAEAAEQERLRQAALAAEKERKQMEEYKRKMEEMARKKREEDQKRREEEERRRKEEEERRKAEEEMMAAMEEAERLEYEQRKREEELEAERRAQEERIRRELEARLAQAEAERLAREIARRQREMERRLAFNRELQSEANVMAHSQEITPMFTWSYFELLDYLGIPIPEDLKDQYEQEKASNTQTSSQDFNG